MTTETLLEPPMGQQKNTAPEFSEYRFKATHGSKYCVLVDMQGFSFGMVSCLDIPTSMMKRAGPIIPHMCLKSFF